MNSKNMTAETAESFQGLAERQQPEDSDAQEVINHIENNETKEKENMGKVFECGKEEKPNEDDKGKAADTENENDAKSREEASKGQQNEDSNEDGLKEDENSATTVVDSDKSGNVSGDKSVQTPSVDATLNKKIKKKDKSSAEEKKLGEIFHAFANSIKYYKYVGYKSKGYSNMKTSFAGKLTLIDVGKCRKAGNVGKLEMLREHETVPCKF